MPDARTRTDRAQKDRPRIDVDAIKRELTCVAVLEAFAPEIALKRDGRDLVGLSPFKAERTASFRIDGPKNVWFCFSSNQGGDAIGLAQRLLGTGFVDTLHRLRDAGLAAREHFPTHEAETAEQRQAREARQARSRALRAAEDKRRAEAELRDDVRRIATAQDIWRKAVPADGTLAEAYLAARGIDIDALEALYGWRLPPTIRFTAACWYDKDGVQGAWPAMIGAMAMRPGDRLAAVHRTYLTTGPDGRVGKAFDAPKWRLPDGSKRASKLMLGKAYGAFTLLTPIGPRAIVGEGFETTLTMLSALAKRGQRVCAISAGSLGNLTGAGIGQGPHPRGRDKPLPSLVPDPARPGLVLPAGIEEVVILADNDGRDVQAVRAQLARGAAKFSGAGLLVREAWPPRGSDFNDLVQDAHASGAARIHGEPVP